MNPYLILWSLALVALVAGDEFFYRRLIAYLRATRLDLDLAGYAAMVAALAVATGLIGPTLDAQSTLTACEGCGKTAYAAKD